KGLSPFNSNSTAISSRTSATASLSIVPIWFRLVWLQSAISKPFCDVLGWAGCGGENRCRCSHRLPLVAGVTRSNAIVDLAKKTIALEIASVTSTAFGAQLAPGETNEALLIAYDLRRDRTVPSNCLRKDRNVMSQHRSLRSAQTLGAKRNVLKRFERV